MFHERNQKRTVLKRGQLTDSCLSPSQATWKLVVAMVFLVPHRNKTPSLRVLNGLMELRDSEHTQPPHTPSHQPEQRLAQSAGFDPSTTETRCGDTNLQSRHPGARSRRKEFKVFLHYSVSSRPA